MNIKLLITFLLICQIGISQNLSYRLWEKKILSNVSFDQVISSLKEESFSTSKNKNDIPVSIIHLLESWNEERKCPFGNEVKFANPTEQFESTDCIIDSKIPQRQLIVVLKNDKHIVLTYRHGGIGLHNHIVWVELRKNIVTDIWIGVTSKSLDSQTKVLEELSDRTKDLNTNIICY